MRHVCRLLLVLNIIHLAACNRKTGIFNKFESQQSVQEPTDSSVRPAGGRRNDRNLVPPLGSANGDLSVLKETLFDPLADWEWSLAERAFAGDVFAVLREGMLTNKAHVDELKATWSDPVVLRFLRDQTPFLKAFKPLRPLFSKEALTPQDVRGHVGEVESKKKGAGNSVIAREQTQKVAGLRGIVQPTHQPSAPSHAQKSPSYFSSHSGRGRRRDLQERHAEGASHDRSRPRPRGHGHAHVQLLQPPGGRTLQLNPTLTCVLLSCFGF